MPENRIFLNISVSAWVNLLKPYTWCARKTRAVPSASTRAGQCGWYWPPLGSG